MRFTYIISALSLGITALAYEIPAACNCNTPGCQYGIGSQGITLQKFSFLAKNGTNNGCRGDVGSKATFQWDSAPCRPYDVYGIAIQDMSSESSYPTGTIMQSKELVGPRVVGLAGHNGTFEESLTISGEGLVKGKRYTVGLTWYNATTGGNVNTPYGPQFVWQGACTV